VCDAVDPKTGQRVNIAGVVRFWKGREFQDLQLVAPTMYAFGTRKDLLGAPGMSTGHLLFHNVRVGVVSFGNVCVGVWGGSSQVQSRGRSQVQP
jgi:hypothetical protein